MIFFYLILRFEMRPPLHIAIVEKNTLGVGGFSKILRNFQSGSWQMLMSAYKVGGVKKGQTCLRNIWMVPNWVAHPMVSLIPNTL